MKKTYFQTKKSKLIKQIIIRLRKKEKEKQFISTRGRVFSYVEGNETTS